MVVAAEVAAPVAKLGTVNALGLEGRGNAPEIMPRGFLLKYDPPTLILEYAQTITIMSGSKLSLAETIEENRQQLQQEDEDQCDEKFYRLQIHPSPSWFDFEQIDRHSQRIAIKLQRRYDRFMIDLWEGRKSAQISSLLSSANCLKMSRRRQQRQHENALKTQKASLLKGLRWKVLRLR